MKLVAAHGGCRAFLPVLRAAEEAHIVNLSAWSRLAPGRARLIGRLTERL